MCLCGIAAAFVQAIVASIGIGRTNEVLPIMEVLENHISRLLFLTILSNYTGRVIVAFPFLIW